MQYPHLVHLDMNSPKPVPVFDVVANCVNSLGNISESMPVPVSLMLITTSLSFLCTATLIVPSFVNFTALISRLEIT